MLIGRITSYRRISFRLKTEKSPLIFRKKPEKSIARLFAFGQQMNGA